MLNGISLLVRNSTWGMHRGMTWMFAAARAYAKNTCPLFHVLARDVAQKSFAFDPQVHIATVEVAMTCRNKSGRKLRRNGIRLRRKSSV